MGKILVVDGERTALGSIEAALRHGSRDVMSACRGDEVLAILEKHSIDLVIADVGLPGMNGMTLLRQIARERPEVPVIMTSGLGSVGDAVEAMELGARNFLKKPLDPDQLASAVDKVLGAARGKVPDEDISAVAGEGIFGGIIGRSRAIGNLLQLVQQIAVTDSTVLITGETGTGKELIGQAIHRASARASRMFCAVNSAAFTETLLESELFGYRRGAFTGADSNKKGILEHADRGTVFLDEIAEMPPAMQAKLLRFLQSGEVRPVGAEDSRFVDLRLVAATNKDLEREVEAGRFREDLYYRLAVIPIHVPALRERVEDIPLLARHFAREFAARPGTRVEGIDAGAMQALCSYDWPGNVRELENAIERGVALCKRGWITLDELPARVRERDSEKNEVGNVDSLGMVERRHILKTLEKVNWNRSQAAQLLEISTTTLWRRLKEFGVDGGQSAAGSGRSLRNA
ncbi:MAG: sigma-54-dependent transcriptional regulator [Planctomycetota bacterium]